MVTTSSEHAAWARALLEDAGVEVDDDERLPPGYTPRVIRLCLACGDRGQAKCCRRCGGSTLVEEIE